jgi:hypothetical protein
MARAQHQGPKSLRRKQALAEGSTAACHLQHSPGCCLKFLDWSAPSQHPNGCLRKAVVGDFKAAGAIGLEVGKAMQVGPTAIKRNIQLQPASAGAAELPLQVLRVSLPLLEATEDMRSPIEPQHHLSKHQPEGHLVDQGFQRAHASIGMEQIRMCPGPGVAMPVSTIMSLHTEPQRIPCKTAAVKSDPSRKTRVGMRRSRKADPALGAQRNPKGGAVVQVPGNRMSLNFQRPLAGTVIDLLVADSEVEWSLAPGAEIKTLQGESLNEGLRLAFGRKPCGPDLNWLPARISGAPTSSRIHQ